ncbi:MAG: nuclear transport factor 2 family protein [Pseudomonadota bacterium]|nr:nuclear transport factor 2 family protein [Pseudomonadota bacterium]
MALLLAIAPALAATLPADLVSAAAAYDKAQIAGDRAELERLLADDYTLVNSASQVEDKAQFIADYTAPGYRLDPFTVREPVEKVWTDGAVLGGLVTLTGVDGGKPYAATLRFADVWARRSGKWQVIFTQVARPPAK